jgi:hypothetical protein
MKNKSTRHSNPRNGPYRHWSISWVLTLVIAGLIPTAGNAYTAAGDRNFPATLKLPQIAPTDALWVDFSTQPMANGYQTQFTGTYSKMITERLGIQVKEGLTRQASVTRAQNFNVQLQDEAIVNQPHEFLLSVQVGQNFGAHTSPPSPTTTPAVTFGKGLGDLPIGYWRPLAITGFAGYQVAEGARTDVFQTGFSVQYSIPYLVSKVANVNLPPFLRGMTPITEVLFTTPVGHVYGQGTNTTLLVAPGISYTRGRGWELGIEAMIPTTKATGSGIGVIAQLVIELDYLLPYSVGRPIFPLTEPR